MGSHRLSSCLILHDDSAFLDRAIRSVREAGPVFAFVSRLPWHGEAGDWEQAARIAGDAGAEVILGDWPSEEEHRRFALASLAEKGFTHALIPDGDEEIEGRGERSEEREARGAGQEARGEGQEARGEGQEAAEPHPGPLLGKERGKGGGTRADEPHPGPLLGKERGQGGGTRADEPHPGPLLGKERGKGGGLLGTLLAIAEHELADRVYVHIDTYWKTPDYVIRPRERFTPCIMLDLRVAQHVHIREFAGGRPLLLSPEHGLIHHYSYAGSNERIHRKITTWSHREEVVPGWWDNVWLAWDDDKLMRNLHPTHPPAYGFAERVLNTERTEITDGRGPQGNSRRGAKARQAEGTRPVGRASPRN